MSYAIPRVIEGPFYGAFESAYHSIQVRRSMWWLPAVERYGLDQKSIQIIHDAIEEAE